MIIYEPSVKRCDTDFFFRIEYSKSLTFAYWKVVSLCITQHLLQGKDPLVRVERWINSYGYNDKSSGVSFLLCALSKIIVGCSLGTMTYTATIS